MKRRVGRQGRGECRTSKVRYRDEESAKYAAASIARQSTRQHVPQRAYYCEFCHGWHVTSQADRYAT